MSDRVQGLSADQLRRRIDPALFDFRTTAEIGTYDGLVGQERAIDAIRLASQIGHRDFNVFVAGPPGTGRHSTVLKLLTDEARARPVPDDLVYVNNFDLPHKPRAMRLRAGVGRQLKAEMEELINDLASDIPALFDSEDYQSQRRALDEEYGERHEEAMSDFVDRCKAESIAVLRTPMGFMLAPIREGQVVKPDDFQKLPEAEQAEIDEKIERLQVELAEILRAAPALEKEHRKRVEELNGQMTERVVSSQIDEALARFSDFPQIIAYLREVHADVIENVGLFLQVAAAEKEGQFAGAVRKYHAEPIFARYTVNLMVSRGPDEAEGAPIVTEHLPTLDHLSGRIEHLSEMGTLITNFTMIKPGALHRANGGYLVLDARQVLGEPFAWDALKRCLKSRSIQITTPAERLGLVSTVSLEPDPFDLDVRVVLVGDRLLHALLVSLDPEFSELFKLQADFEETVDLSDETILAFGKLLAGFAEHENLIPLTSDCVARVLEEAVRLAEDSTKLSLRIGSLADLLREADHYAKADGAKVIGAENVEKAVAEKERRESRIRDRLRESVRRGILMIDTHGERVGQINGLSVVGLGGTRFGQPSRITARVRMGEGEVVDIEREVELGGPLHSKGVMILSGYLSAAFATDVPLSLRASLVFEQNYGGVDGDSASSTELYALLSALAEVPIDQGIAVTGSVNQSGEIQAIGGVNEKIEGFFDICAERGLTGDQGVLIPASNVEHLALRDRVVEAVQAGKFRIIPVRHVDEGIAILTGKPAGQRVADGKFPEGSVNALVEARLRGFAEARRAFGQPGKED
ncbi:MAG: AAA family ATPase [Rhodobacteraceae bacterium]|nr:AAA family ATPase [Paracoccaceae bacterium]